MGKDEHDAGRVTAGLNRRELMAGAAATAYFGTAQTAAATDSTEPFRMIGLGALYDNDVFKLGITHAYSDVLNNQRKLQAMYQPMSKMTWGDYQKALFPLSSNIWKTQTAFDNWPYFVDAVRNSLEKQPHHVQTNADAPNPHDPTERPSNVVDHLDKVVQHALWEIGVPATILINEKDRRHHVITTKWDPSPPWALGAPPANASLTITIDCPRGGWQGYATSRNRSSGANRISNFVAKWKVPPEPVNVNGDQIIFLFNGLESITSPGAIGGILQPVLQWTKETKWAVRNWYMRADFDPLAPKPGLQDLPALDKTFSRYDIPFYDPRSGAIQDNRTFSIGKQVSPGAEIIGTISYSGDSNGLPTYTCSFTYAGQHDPHTDLQTPGIPELVYAACAVESYYTTNAQDYPAGPLTMYDLALTQGGSANWVVNPPQILLRYTTTFASNTVTFAPPP